MKEAAGSSAPDQKMKKRSRLTTFRAPDPSPLLMRILAPVNRAVMLQGMPGLNRLPLVRRIPGLGGVMQVPEITFSDADRRRLQRMTDENAAVFLTPNHPEFFTDWMLDKFVMSATSPLAASWATHEIVNGLGKAVQTFWLKNNLIAQIPGEGGQAGKVYSIRWARKGHGVLLHPEGSVAWHGDRIGPLFSGAADMACETAKQLEDAGDARATFIAPVIWKLFFIEDVGTGLHREADHIEAQLRLPRSSRTVSPAERLLQIYEGLLARDEVSANIHPTNAAFPERQKRLLVRLSQRLSDKIAKVSGQAAAENQDEVLQQARRWLRVADRDTRAFSEISTLNRTLKRTLRFDPAWYSGENLTQEHVAECLKRVRADYCRGSMRDVVHNYLPVPVGPRRAVIRVPEPIRVTVEDQLPGALTEQLRHQMQSCLDEINSDNQDRQNRLPVYPNPFR